MGTGGRLSIFREGYTFTPGPAHRGVSVKGGGAPETGHMPNWLDCVRSRKDPAVPVEEGHYSAMACHVGNLAYREKRMVKWQNE